LLPAFRTHPQTRRKYPAAASPIPPVLSLVTLRQIKRNGPGSFWGQGEPGAEPSAPGSQLTGSRLHGRSDIYSRDLAWLIPISCALMLGILD
jgi:hypothetical protein